MGELVAGVLLAAGAMVFVLRPVFQPQWRGRPLVAPEGDEGDEPEDDLSPRAVALRALKEIEFDRATGKLSDADYETLKMRYTAEALAALRAEAAEPRRDAAAAPGAPARPRAAALAGRVPSGIYPPACPVHGPRSEPEATFCSECGRRLAPAPAYCTRCGTALEREARYCQACGARVAA